MNEHTNGPVELTEDEIERIAGGLLPGFDEVEIDGGTQNGTASDSDPGLAESTDPLQGWATSPMGA